MIAASLIATIAREDKVLDDSVNEDEEAEADEGMAGEATQYLNGGNNLL